MCTVLVLTRIMLIVWLFVYYHVAVMGISILFLLSVSNYDVEGFVLPSTCSNCSQSIKIPYCSLSCAVMKPVLQYMYIFTKNK